MIHSWMEALMWGIIFIATCIGGYFTGKLRLSGRVSDFLKAEMKVRTDPGELRMLLAVADFLDRKAKGN